MGIRLNTFGLLPLATMSIGFMAQGRPWPALAAVAYVMFAGTVCFIKATGCGGKWSHHK